VTSAARPGGPRRVLGPLQDFLRLEASGGVVLLAATAAALVWANVAPGSYEDLWGAVLTLDVGGFELSETVRDLVNDGLMTIFFLVIGLEVKRELTVGELSTRGAALLPVFAAVGGMLVPALVFLAVIGAGDGSRGWGIPMATDVAFAVGALVALGSRVPPALVAFLLGVAVIDDIGAILVIAIYYTDALALGWLAAALGGLAAIVALQRLRVGHIGPYIVLGLAVWFCAWESGVHPTIAGVLIGLLTPVRPLGEPAAVADEAVSPLVRVEHALHGWSSYVVLPVFALANAGIVLDADSLEAATETRVAVAVAVALVLGKAIGLTAGVAIAVRLGLSTLPAGARWAHMCGVGALAGIGFTVSLFIAGLAYSDPDLLAAAKIGVLGGSVVAAATGIALLLAARRRAAASDLT
jgi:Na+:H+ antiporter, NhaA family